MSVTFVISGEADRTLRKADEMMCSVTEHLHN